MARRWVGVLVVALIASSTLAGRGAVAAASAQTQPRIDATLAWVDRSKGLVVADPNTGETRIVKPSGSWCGSCSFVRIDRHLFGADGHDLYALRLRDGHGRRIASASGVRVFAATGRSAVYIADNYEVGGSVALELIGTHGKRLGGPWRVPPGYRLAEPARAVSDGVLVERDDNASRRWLEIWKPYTGQLEPIGSFWQLIDTYTARNANDSLIARLDCDDLPCALLLYDTASQTTTRIDGPTTANGFFGGGAFSPDGTTLAAFAATSRPANVDPAVKLSIIDVEAGRVNLVENSGVAVGEPYGYAAWSLSGDWLIFGGLQDDVNAFRPRSRALATLPKIKGNYSISVLPARVG
jgi:hypothetical protein